MALIPPGNYNNMLATPNWCTGGELKQDIQTPPPPPSLRTSRETLLYSPVDETRPTVAETNESIDDVREESKRKEEGRQN